MHESPRMRRLRNDLAALERLQAESSVFRFKAKSAQHFVIRFLGKSLWRSRTGQVKAHEDHQVEVKLGASYPRTIPEIRWITPIYHPNISEIGMVCLGGYGTHWVPSVQLDELCNMLWDMARYHNYDIRSPYNRDAALWAASQTSFLFPTDSRPLRDLRAALGRVESEKDLPAKNHGGTNGSARASDSVEPPAARILRLMNRYSGIFAKGPEKQGRTHGEQAVDRNEAPTPAAADSPPVASSTPAPPPEGGEEIILLESANPADRVRAEHVRESVDGITFID